MSDREQRNLRGPLKSCTEQNTVSGWIDAEGKTYPEVHWEDTTEYDMAGHLLNTRSRNSDGSTSLSGNSEANLNFSKKSTTLTDLRPLPLN
jgi:hypothetical protein